MSSVREPNPGEEVELLLLEEDQYNDLKDKRIAAAKLQTHFVALANSDGGDLYIGVKDKTEAGERIDGFTSVEDANDYIEVLFQGTDPQPTVASYEFIDFANRGYVLLVSVAKSAQIHYTADKRCYIRVNASTREIKGAKITALAQSKGIYSFERTPVENISIDELAESKYFTEYLSRIKSHQEPEVFLQKQKLTHGSGAEIKPSVAAALLFHDEPSVILSTKCAIKIYRLLTDDAEYDRKHLSAESPMTIEGPVEHQIISAIKTVDKLLKNATFNIGGKLEKLKYPSETLEEILVNAVIHRDYSLNDDIHIRIYNSRIEIESPGKLPGYMTVSTLLSDRFSRNPQVGRYLHKLPNPPNKDIGEGLNTAFTRMHEAGLKPPEFEEKTNTFRVVIRHQSLASIEDVITTYLGQNAKVTNKVIRDLTGEKSENLVKKAFQRLRDEGKIEPVDPNANPFQYAWQLKT